MKKFHTDIYMPDWIKQGQIQAVLKYTRHARQEAMNDKRGPIQLPQVFDSAQAKLIEAVAEEGKLIKALYRQPYSDGLDLCLVLSPTTRSVITVWLQSDEDHHATLDRSAYDKD